MNVKKNEFMKNRLFLLVGGIFFIVGVVFLIGTIWSWLSTQRFLNTAETATGTVKELLLVRSGGESGGYVYYPVVEYETRGGEKVEFQSTAGSSPASYTVGENVEVLYVSQKPQEAKIKGFMDVWFLVVIFGVFGVVFTLLGGVFLSIDIGKIKRRKWLLQNGLRIETKIDRSELNASVSVNGKNPYVIISQWQDPATQKIYLFESEDIWFNPEQYVKNRTVPVLVDPKNYKKYYMDISFLPKEG